MIPVFTLEIVLIMDSEVVCLWYNYTIIHGQNPYHSYITSGYCTITCSCCYKSCLWTHFVCTCRSMQGENMSDIMDYVVEILI